MCVIRFVPTVTISTRFEVDTTIRCWHVMWPWPFDCGQWLHMARQVFNALTKFEDPMLIHSWVTSYDNLHQIALAMHLHHCKCTISCDLCVDWQIFPTYLKSLARFVYVQLIWLDEINRVIRQNSVWPCVKGYRAVCTCAKTHHRQQVGKTITHLETPTPICLFIIPPPLPSNRHHRSSGNCLEGKGENYQVCSVQYCVQQLCTVRCTHIW